MGTDRRTERRTDGIRNDKTTTVTLAAHVRRGLIISGPCKRGQAKIGVINGGGSGHNYGCMLPRKMYDFEVVEYQFLCNLARLI